MGEHIQMLRKNAGLSQEELGEKLGVARQSVSKWESDATIPELDKLIAMSKLFGVSLGTLLGLEESDGGDRELTDRELAALEAIAQRLTPAKKVDPEEQPRKKRRWPTVVATMAVIVAGVVLMGRISDLEKQINSLHYNISNIDNTVSRQIGSLTNQVRDILEEQNSVTAGKNYELVDIDLRGQQVTFSLTATPREYREGMMAAFSATGPDFETVEVPGDLGAGQAFTAELTCPLTDDVTLWVAFIGNGSTVTQQIGQVWSLLSSTQVSISGHLKYSIARESEGASVIALTAQAWQSQTGWYKTRAEGGQEIKVAQGTLRLWKGEELIWSQEHRDVAWPPVEEVAIPAEGLTLAPGDRLILSLLYTDSAGREGEVFVDGFKVNENGDPGWLAPYAEELEYPWEKGV